MSQQLANLREMERNGELAAIPRSEYSLSRVSHGVYRHLPCYRQHQRHR